MNPISVENIQARWSELEQLSMEEQEILVSDMSAAQPDILVYLTDVGEELLDQEEKEVLLSFAVVVWFIMSKENTTAKQVEEISLDEIEQKNIELLEALEVEAEETLWDKLELLLNEHNQSEIMNLIADELLSSVDENLIKEERFLLLLFILKTVVDALDED
ncbi:MAG: hypothetical protein DKM50_10855 [Candidatus Margulisiibacteriota bacterium]|nr:MAG: hypothetical protein A2X43_07665 [Candidatus Margulisbacteria bacterium GWD2_39_127]OGI03900.1 MAG: hypothetical protein A2X42_10070 [Candidatus Margulisbacteria bacterium GWF2_38_17]OGI08795.1 MAG: hypothetical protein A2X41_05045 [Candidatus Margulisbacteria bacterium GWE2_39_32]PZM78626.1 MAG: hypothetical protein DKM50_10855 [Candidatus Margulisiibacteriota bacterium]HAR61967.1 hypothetical protein [Candidatus Margulisiibacteriota bacterium]